MKYIISITLMLFSVFSVADDWGGVFGDIDKMYIYPDKAIIIQGNTYAGTANCTNNNKWAFYWNALDPVVAQRVHSMLLAAYMGKVQIKPGFHSTECGPEGNKKFTGHLVFE